MASEIAVFERFFRSAVLALPEVAACVGAKVCNQSAPQNTQFPYAIFTVIPLEDVYGQARASLLTRVFVDLKFSSHLPLPDSIDAAVSAVKDYFRIAKTFDYEDCRITVWHKTPINFQERGTVAAEKIFSRGGTFAAHIVKIYDESDAVIDILPADPADPAGLDINPKQ